MLRSGLFERQRSGVRPLASRFQGAVDLAKGGMIPLIPMGVVLFDTRQLFEHDAAQAG